MSDEERPGDDPKLPTPPETVESALEVARRTNRSERLLKAARFMRERLPGDSELGDPLSTAGTEPSHLLARRVSEHSEAKGPSVARELGLGALQVWQALSETQGRGQGDIDMAILFADLVDFSSWALEAGDEAVLRLLREMGVAAEAPIRANGGEVVKRMGDGLMAVFADPTGALEAALHACEAVGELEVLGHRPQLRAGVHVGRPRRLGGDYLGVDVNVAARVMGASGGGQVLVSETAAARIPDGAYELKPQRRFRAKGAPKDLKVFTVKRSD